MSLITTTISKKNYIISIFMHSILKAKQWIHRLKNKITLPEEVNSVIVTRYM